jgi:hypothetical protein
MKPPCLPGNSRPQAPCPIRFSIILLVSKTHTKSTHHRRLLCPEPQKIQRRSNASPFRSYTCPSFPCESPKTTPYAFHEIWYKLTRWMCDSMPGVHFKHFTARDMVSRWDVLQAYPRATANNASGFLEVVSSACPSRTKPCKWMGAVSSWPSLNRPAKIRPSSCLCCHPAHLNLMGVWSVPSVPTPRSSIRCMRMTGICLPSTRSFRSGNVCTTTSNPMLRLTI